MTSVGSSPWHEGEREAQRRAGVADRLEETGRRAIRPFMPEQHREFFAGLPYVFVASSDREGRVWASVVTGSPGFVSSPAPNRLRVAAALAHGDPLAEALQPGAPLGLLGLDFATRRRNRANGRIEKTCAAGFTLAVEQSFGNCPKYIAQCEVVGLAASAARAVEPLDRLDEPARRVIGEAAVFFVASSPGVDALPDVSHRGGAPGFVRIDSDGDLTIPDYGGNLYFNTLGNFLLHPRAGLLFVDFANGDLLQLHGATDVLWEGRNVESLPGAERAWRFHMTAGRWLRGALALRFSEPTISPFSPAPGVTARSFTTPLYRSAPGRNPGV